MKYFCTIFTPAYNRAHLLRRLYDSIVIQTNKDFEWIVVDDGSEDNTEEVMLQFIKENKIDIKYIKVENGGKHRAVNRGVVESSGKVFAIVDSDDMLVPNAVEKLAEWFEDIEKESDKKICGVSACKGHDEERIIGTTFEGEWIDATSIERKKYNIFGDKFEVFYTEVLKKYPFPEFEGERFMSEIVVWTRLARDGYLIRWHQEVLYLCEYLGGGLTANNFKLLANNPKGYALRIREQVEYADLSIREKWGYYSNYYFLRRKKESFLEMCKNVNATRIEMYLAIIFRICLMAWRRNFNEYKEI